MKNSSTFKDFCHAEIDLISKIKNKKTLKNLKIFVFRFNNSTHPNARVGKNAKPCLFCQHILKKHDVSRVYYFSDEGVLSVLKNSEMSFLVACPYNITYFISERYGSLHIDQRDYLEKNNQ